MLCVWWSWKLDSSTTMTSQPMGSRIASSTGTPTLPQAIARLPSAISIDVANCTVVVLPFVPVTASQGAGVPTLSRSRHASSTSPHTGTPDPSAQRISGWLGGNPGEVTTRSGAKSERSSVLSAPRSRVTSPAPITVSSSERWGSASDANTSTSAPSSTRVSATENPVTPSPSTATLSPRQSACQLVSAAICAGDFIVDSQSARQPFEVEEPDTKRDEQSGDDPEAHHNRHLTPALHLKVMVKGTRPPDAFALGELEVRALQNHRHGDDNEKPTNENEEQLRAREDCQRGECATQAERTRIAHHDLGRRRVPPEEPHEGADDGSRNCGELEGAGELVTLVDVCLAQPGRVAPLGVLPETDDHIRPDGENG